MSFSEYSNSIVFYLNGKRIVVRSLDLDMTLLQYLRSIGLTGTKLGCGEGGCGACTVMVSRYDTHLDKIIHTSANACLCPLYSIDGKHVITVEGLGTAKKPHPVQERIALLHGSQCGFCTPGFVMSLYTLLRNNPNPTELEIEECFDGNLCRCTGYRPILDAAKTFADQAWKQGSVNADGSVRAPDKNDGGCGIEDCCRLQKKGKLFSLPATTLPHTGTSFSTDISGATICCGKNANSVCCKSTAKTMPDSDNLAEIEKARIISKFQMYDPTQELIFPPFLIRYANHKTAENEPQMRPLKIESTNPQSWCQRFFRPLTLDELLVLLKEYPSAKLVAGNSRVCLDIKLEHLRVPVHIYINDIPELRQISEHQDHVSFGASVTIAQFEHKLKELINKYGLQRAQSLSALHSSLSHFAGNQIRNVSTIAGNIAIASPISDLSPVFMAAGAYVTLVAAENGSKRQVPMCEFFLGYRKTAMRTGEVILNICVPFNQKKEIVRSFKQAKRKSQDIAIVNCGLRVRVDEDTGDVVDAAFAFGGMAQTTVLAKNTIASAIGGKWGDRSLLDRIIGTCQNELRLGFAIRGGMAEYRSALMLSFLFKFWAISCNELQINCAEAAFAAEVQDESRRMLTKGKQEYASITDRAIVGKGVTHRSALQQATGEARYVNDTPLIQGELFIGLVMSQRAHARIISIDSIEALRFPGVHRVLTACDVPGSNTWTFSCDEEVLPTEEVHYMGQPIALVLADSQKVAQEAARMVRVEYEDLPAIFTMREAIAQNSFFDEVREVSNGDVDAAFAQADFVFKGESYCGQQEHFYLETMSSIAVPKGESGELDLYTTTQGPTGVQMECAKVLGVPASRIVCHVKRVGGSFGGKESRATLIAAFSALGAYHTNKPVRIVLERNEDMQTSGQRHPYLGQWEVGVTRDGKLLGLRMRVFSNGGFSHDASVIVMEHTLTSADNCYMIPNTSYIGRICRTNTQSSTAFRGFGSCQGMFLLESMLCEVADLLELPVEQIREINMYKTGDITPYAQCLTEWNVPLMWEQIKQKGEFAKRRREIDEFNSRTRYRKRGLSLLPTKFGITFGVNFMHQAMALVHVYMDGSVLVTHGGVEMGQGLHTKMAMIAAETLELPLESIFISETATNTAANTSPTAASISSDLNGYAVHNACKELADRLQPYRERMKGEPFSKIAKAAYLDRCSLTASSHYNKPTLSYSWKTNKGLLHLYYTQGVALAEVELDTLTGAHTTRRVDIIMDVGKSLNKAIDIGQIEGAFTQGQGWTTTEEYLYSPQNGQLVTQGPSNYKIPSALDIARDFRVSLLEGVPNSTLKTIFSSKGIGEPPLFLGASVFFALRDAVLAARKHSVSGALHLESPATPEVLRLACKDDFVDMARIPDEQKKGSTPFAVRI
ncbi:hypothetical protein GGI25_003886 [Coemansia spiralis]|uniref:xanthine dehydrogenase n=2 Tax=Coemansia TaxID=4863 RepID=A0A9W8G7M6_9FUNG|nr:hypothetical protein EDC05_003668 [Coemansia umbellata]KAJ2621120.1 hypothetical protein GGI26_004383 [Coemansia sp. RSA 1358]KAJ2675688.1 hypothetical protein GGI25_003886 [Coemansia spiralis]